MVKTFGAPRECGPRGSCPCCPPPPPLSVALAITSVNLYKCYSCITKGFCNIGLVIFGCHNFSFLYQYEWFKRIRICVLVIHAQRVKNNK